MTGLILHHADSQLYEGDWSTGEQTWGARKKLQHGGTDQGLN